MNNFKIPQRVREGDPVSAAWMNSVVEALRSADAMLSKRRILAGTGYSVTESAGGSSLTIDKQQHYLRESEGLPLFVNYDFELRIKPKELCEVEDDGNWPRIVQVHIGSVTNRKESLVVDTYDDGSDDDDSTPPPPPASGGEEGEVAPWDAEDWVDLVELEGEDVEVFVCLSVDSAGAPTKAVFVTEQDETDSGNTYIPVGTVSSETVEEETNYYITQNQLGPIELGGDTTRMPFDVSIGPMELECADELEEEQKEDLYVNVEEGRVFLPEAKYATIPRKRTTELSSAPLKAENGYLIFELSLKADGSLEYSYRIDGTLDEAIVTASEKAPENG